LPIGAPSSTTFVRWGDRVTPNPESPLFRRLFGPRLLRLLDEEAEVPCLAALVRYCGALTTWREKCSLASALGWVRDRLTSRSLRRGTL
jgi:hypothetical protein